MSVLFGKDLVLLGAVLILTGAVLMLFPKIYFRGRLPGDLLIRPENLTVYERDPKAPGMPGALHYLPGVRPRAGGDPKARPLTTSLLFNVIASVVAWLIEKK